MLHQLFRIEWSALKLLEPPDAVEMLREFGDLLAKRAEPGEMGWSGAYRIAGGGIDVMLLHFRPDLEGLIQAGHEIQLSALGDFLSLEQEYISVVEMGLYALTATLAETVEPADREAWNSALDRELEGQREQSYIKKRLYPVQPEAMPYVCYYPMDKRRSSGQNWYTLSLQKRAALMSAHGSIGRQYAGRISQVISGSMGLADWEWAVTLWAPDPIEFKNIISEMRYDEASAEYADFGRFFVGKRMHPSEFGDLLAKEDA